MFTRSTHAIDPFKHPPVEDDEEDEGAGEAPRAHRDRALPQHVSASGPSLYFSRLLPDAPSRYAFILVAIAALAISTFWLINTIQVRLGRELRGRTTDCHSGSAERSAVHSLLASDLMR